MKLEPFRALCVANLMPETYLSKGVRRCFAMGGTPKIIWWPAMPQLGFNYGFKVVIYPRIARKPQFIQE
jgi:hypothetical protein